MDQGRLSSAQHETLVYANMRFNGPRLPGGACGAVLQWCSMLFKEAAPYRACCVDVSC